VVTLSIPVEYYSRLGPIYVIRDYVVISIKRDFNVNFI
jgi:hypothetical protein